MEEFFNVLTSRGVRISSSEQAEALGSAVCDVARTLGMADEANDRDAPHLASAAASPA
jgi:hypothetical protein